MGGPPADWLADPTGQHSLRYWDGETYTEWVADDGVVSKDPLFVPPSGRPQGISHTTPGGGSAGEAVLRALSFLTLNTWMNNRMARAWLVPELTAMVQHRPDDPRRLLWLGLRLQEMERTKARINQALPPVSIEGMLLRPVLRSAARAVGGGRQKASERVLSLAWQLLAKRLDRTYPRRDDLCLMARVYSAGGESEKAWEVAKEACAPPGRSEAAYIMAEAMLDCGSEIYAIEWARRSVEAGCSLGRALLHRDTPFRRRAWMTTEKRAAVMPTSEDFWAAKARYYEGVDPHHLVYYFGPSPIYREQFA